MRADRHTDLLRRATKRAASMEARLAALIEPVLDGAADEAARSFTEHATDHLTAALIASAPSPQSTMIALKPTAEQAAMLAHPDGDPADSLHVTLVYLGETDGNLAAVVDAARAVAARHAPLSGVVGGSGSFAAEESGSPSILLPDVPGMNELRADLVTTLSGAGVDYARSHGFTPHVTLRYSDTPELAGLDSHGAPLNFDSLLVVRGDVPVAELPLHGSLRASGAPTPTWDLTRGSELDLRFIEEADKAGFTERSYFSWPHEGRLNLTGEDDVLFRDGENSALLRLPDGSLAAIRISDGYCTGWAAEAAHKDAHAVQEMFAARYPFTQLSATEERVPVTFWTYGPFGPQSRLRMIEASPWSSIERNYPAETRDQLADMMLRFSPGKDGQLVLWQGAPGTGKTWALRALASEWLDWAEFHYITDPDAFFVDQPSYMINVLLADEHLAVDEPSSTEVFHQGGDGKWRVLILEDTGELLAADARDKSGQGLSRLLNVVDGMIGQGLKVLCIVTTNDELGELNDAVRRPGRCAAQIVFAPLAAEEATEWLGEGIDAPATLAELYQAANANAEEDEDEEAIVAAGEQAGWTAPFSDEVIDVPALVQKLHTKTDPVRRAVIETVVGGALEEAGLDFDVTNPFISKLLAKSASQITNIAQTTQLNAMRIIRESYQGGLSIPDTAKAIRFGMKEATQARATLIARTELAGAVNGASLAGTQVVGNELGIAYMKEWLTADGATFPRHEDYDGLDGQTVTLDEYFDVGGVALQFPGDPDGPPEDICNCRCSLAYVEPDGTEVEGVGVEEGAAA